MEGPFLKDGCTPKEVVAGNGFSVVVTEEGVVYSWGSGEFGRLGYCDTRRQTHPRQISDLRPNKILKVALGSYHACAISDQGAVFTWGRGNSGQLGRGNVMNEDSVRQVSALQDEKIIDVACGEAHTCVLTESGEVYTWGAGQAGQLGHGDYLRQSLPIKVANIPQKISQIACGKRHTACVSIEGIVYSWGSNEFGQLGRTAPVTPLKLNVKRNPTVQNILVGSAKTSPQTNFIQTNNQFMTVGYHKIPLSTDN